MRACGLRAGLRSAVRHPHSSSNDAVCVVVRSRSTSGQHVFVKSSNSFTFSLHEGSLTGQQLGLVLSLVLLVSHASLVPHASFVALVSERESASSFASSVNNSSYDVGSHLFSMIRLLIPSETCSSISPIRPFNLLTDSLSMTSSTLLKRVVRLCRGLVDLVAGCHRFHDLRAEFRTLLLTSSVGRFSCPSF